MCTQKPPHDFSQQLYERYREAFNEYITTKVRESNALRSPLSLIHSAAGKKPLHSLSRDLVVYRVTNPKNQKPYSRLRPALAHVYPSIPPCAHATLHTPFTLTSTDIHVNE
jgi:hypothetical protein